MMIMEMSIKLGLIKHFFGKSLNKFHNYVKLDTITINCQKSQTLDGYITRSWTDKCIDKTKH